MLRCCNEHFIIPILNDLILCFFYFEFPCPYNYVILFDISIESDFKLKSILKCYKLR